MALLRVLYQEGRSCGHHLQMVGHSRAPRHIDHLEGILDVGDAGRSGNQAVLVAFHLLVGKDD